ncbi:MAG TPA: hypothetical protein VG984_02740 [Candidatus Paceibacterota bacterium]|nr:hypothetical protein [Candidatus Paceibacterota bacterium]
MKEFVNSASVEIGASVLSIGLAVLFTQMVPKTWWLMLAEIVISVFILLGASRVTAWNPRAYKDLHDLALVCVVLFWVTYGIVSAAGW